MLTAVLCLAIFAVFIESGSTLLAVARGAVEKNSLRGRLIAKLGPVGGTVGVALVESAALFFSWGPLLNWIGELWAGLLYVTVGLIHTVVTLRNHRAARVW